MQNIKHICVQIMPPSMKESLDASKMMTTLYMSYFCRLHKLLIILYLHNNTAMWVKQIQIQTNNT